MGNMMGKCTGSCTADEVRTGCPVAKLSDPTPANPLPNGHCDGWSQSHATGVGYWPFAGCADAQPLPALFNDTVATIIIIIVTIIFFFFVIITIIIIRAAWTL